MTTSTYYQFCPVAMAAEILGSRWTIVLLRELCAGSTRFNDLRRGVPRMSPALLSKRLKELEVQGVVERRLVQKHPKIHDYTLTKAGEELKPVIMAIGVWGQRWVEASPSLKNTDPSLLMWDMRRNLRVMDLPNRKLTIQFMIGEDQKPYKKYWIISGPKDGVDLCSVDPGFDVDLYVKVDLRTITAIWMGLETVERALDDDRLFIHGDTDIASNMQSWLGLSPFAAEEKQVVN
jgi:DNA-binding HxlR family transcriptional regulator